MFDLSVPKLLVLTVIALVIFGPNELPTIVSQVGRVPDQGPSSSPRARPRRTARSSRRANRPTRPLTTKRKEPE